jgi:hypothetical protein
MQMTTRRSTAALLALVLVAPCYALFEDQAGTYDWYKAYVGHVVGGAFHRTRPRVYLGTAQGVAGSLNLRDGSIAWRQKLDETSGVQSTLLLDGSGKEEQLFFTLTDGHLRAWDPSDGYLKWQADTGGSGNAAMAALPDEKIATFTSSQIKVWIACSPSYPTALSTPVRLQRDCVPSCRHFVCILEQRSHPGMFRISQLALLDTFSSRRMVQLWHTAMFQGKD